MDEIRLRPHHLLCTQTYSGKGYSDKFVANMDSVTERLRNESDIKVEIVFSTDNVCDSCPFKVREGVCQSDAKVLGYDEGVIKALGLKEGIYSYQELISRLNDYLLSHIENGGLNSICADCEWYEICNNSVYKLSLQK